MTNSTRKRILLADDHAAMLDEVSSLLREDYEVVGRVADGAALVEAATRLKPDLVISDISMPEMTGFEAAAVSAVAVALSMPLTGRSREVVLRFGHPYAVVAVTTDADGSAAAWHGLPVFSAWVSEPEDATDT